MSTAEMASSEKIMLKLSPLILELSNSYTNPMFYTKLNQIISGFRSPWLYPQIQNHVSWLAINSSPATSQISYMTLNSTYPCYKPI